VQEIPLVDLADGANVAADIEAACRDIGFMYVVGHGIEPHTIAAARSAVIDFFALPLDAKLTQRISRENYRGYIPTGFFSANSGGAATDSYEGYKLHHEVRADDPIRACCDLYGPNKWPDALPNFKAGILGYWRECDRVASELLMHIADILGTPTDAFLQRFDYPLTNMTLLHYPPQAPDAEGFGIHPHKDTDALTILAPDPVGGLFVKQRDAGGWIKVQPPGGALVVNLGDLLELWSGGYFVSTPHKVINSSGAERYSFPYFAVPRYDTLVKPLKEPHAGFDRCEVDVGDVSREVWRTNWPDTTPSDPSLDLGTLDD
jgi:isopenicillin N synthase-like dioxygenase